VVTNTIPLSPAGAACSKIRVLSIAQLLARAIQSIHEGGSISTLFI
jgi:ribose-phosphate pyrophosphokinase